MDRTPLWRVIENAGILDPFFLLRVLYYFDTRRDFWVAAIYVYVLIVILFKAIFTIHDLLNFSCVSSPASSERRLV